MGVGLACGPLALHQDRVLAGGSAEGQLIECQNLAAVLHDPLPRLLCHLQRAHLHLGHVQEPGVVRHGAYDHGDGLGLLALLHEAGDALQRNWWPVRAAHKQTAQDDAVELALGTTVQESVQLKRENGMRFN